MSTVFRISEVPPIGQEGDGGPFSAEFIWTSSKHADDPAKGGWEDDTQEWRPCPSGHHFDLAVPGLFGAKFAEDGCADQFGGDGEAKIAAASQAALAYRFGKNNTKGTAA